MAATKVPKLKMIIKTEGKWYEDDDTELPDKNDSEVTEAKPTKFLRKEEIVKLKSSAENLLFEDIKAYKACEYNVKARHFRLWLD